MLTESVTIPLEGEQAALFRGIEAEEEVIKAKRNAMVTAIIAGKGLLGDVERTPVKSISVTSTGGIVITVPPSEKSDGSPGGVS